MEGCARRSARAARVSFRQRGLKAGGIERQQRLQVGERRLGALVAVDGRRSETVVAAPGGEVVERSARAGCVRGTTRKMAARRGPCAALVAGERGRPRRTPRPARSRRAAAHRRRRARAGRGGGRGDRRAVPTYGPSMPTCVLSYQRNARSPSATDLVLVAQTRARRHKRLGQPGVVVGQDVLAIAVVRRVGSQRRREPCRRTPGGPCRGLAERFAGATQASRRTRRSGPAHLRQRRQHLEQEVHARPAQRRAGLAAITSPSAHAARRGDRRRAARPASGGRRT